MNYYEPLRYTVTEEEDGWLLRTVMRNRMGVSRRLLTRLKRTEKGILVNGERAFTNRKMVPGDRIELHMEAEQSEYIEPEEMPLQIVYEDAALLVINKAPGVIVHPTHGHYSGTLANGVLYYWQEKGEQYRFRPIHRLDEHTSGLVMIAKNPYVHQQVDLQMRQNKVLKEYAAVVHGCPENEKGTIDAPIDRDPLDHTVRVVLPTGARAVTHYEVAETFSACSLLRVQLETGRTHQIRVHMQHIGCPLVGEPVYMTDQYRNAPINDKIDRQALHAARVVLTHPTSGSRLELEAPLPEDMKHVIDSLND